MSNIFISHSNEDNENTLFIVNSLRRAGYGVWVDFENIRGGAEWLCEIQAGIERCDAVVIALSAASQQSSWVERECLYAFQLKKPVITALIADVLIPLHLINIQYCDLRDRQVGMRKLLESLASMQHRQETSATFVPAVVSREPVVANFFPYVAQLPSGDIASLVARDLFHWSRQVADEVAFGGKVNPGFHARIKIDDQLVTVFSIWAFMQTPSAQMRLDLLSTRAAFSKRAARRALLRTLNQILPRSARLAADKADRRPTFALHHLGDAQKLEAFKQLAFEIMDRLREPGQAGSE